MPFVQSVGFQGDAVNSIQATLNGVAGGNFLATLNGVSVGGTPTNSAPTDTQSNGWSTTTEPTSQGGGNAFLCYAEDVAAGNTTVTLDYGTGFYITGEFAEFSGVVVVSPLDQQTSGSSAWSNSPATGTTGTLAQADELVLAVVGGQASNANEGFDVPATTGYTNLYVEQDGSLHESGSGDYKFVAATTGVSAAWGTTTASIPWSAKLATFKLAAGQSAAIGQVSETDTAQPLGVYVPVGFKVRYFALEGLGPMGAGPVGAYTRGQFVSGGSSATIGQASEADLAQAFTSRQVKAIGQATETDLAQTLAVLQARTLGQASEADSAQPVTQRQSRAIGQASESDTAQSVSQGGAAAAIGQAVETDAAQALTSAQRRAIGQATETDSAQPVSQRQARAVGQAAETDLAQPVAQAQRLAIGLVQETDSALQVAGAGAQALGQASEADLAQPFSNRQAKAISQAAETDAAQILVPAARRTIGQAAEADAALAVAQRLSWQIGIAAELDEAQEVGAVGGEPPLVPAWRSKPAGSGLTREGAAAGVRSPAPGLQRTASGGTRRGTGATLRRR